MLTFINLAFCPGSVQASHCEKKGHPYLLTCYRDLEQPAAEYIRQVPDGAYCTITATEEVFKNFENFGIRESLSMRAFFSAVTTQHLVANGNSTVFRRVVHFIRILLSQSSAYILEFGDTAGPYHGKIRNKLVIVRYGYGCLYLYGLFTGMLKSNSKYLLTIILLDQYSTHSTTEPRTSTVPWHKYQTARIITRNVAIE
jgi:hypothetical protein